MRVLVLEDDDAQQGRIETALLDIAKTMRIKLHVDIAKSYRDLQVYQNFLDHYQLYFLDLEVDNDREMGFKVAKEIREHDPYTSLVFVSALSESATLAFRYHLSALDFIVKDHNEEVYRDQIRSCVEHVLHHNHLTEERNLFTYMHDGRQGFSVPYRDLLAIETTGDSHRLKLYCTNSSKIFYGSLAEIVEQDRKHQLEYASRFLLVNIDNVKECLKGEVVFLDGMSFPASRTGQRTLKKRLVAREETDR